MKLRNIIVMLLVMTLVSATLLPYSAAADDGHVYKLAYSVNDDGKTVTVTGFEQSPTEEYDLVIPRSVKIDSNKYLVTEIAANAFNPGASNTLMQTVSLPATLKKIGDTAFKYNAALTSVKFPASLTHIGSFAFQSCAALVDIGVIPENVVLGSDAFNSDNKLQNRNDDGQIIFIPGSVTLGNKLFKNARSWRMAFGEGITSIPAETLYAHATLRFLALPSTCTTLGGNSLNKLNNITNFYILSDTLSIANNTFKSDTIGNESLAYSVTVMNTAVKNVLVEAGFNADFIHIAAEPVTIVVESPESYTVYTDDTVELPLPELDGYIFKGYTDGVNTYSAGDVFDARSVYESGKGRIISGIWVPDNEYKTVLYKNVAQQAETVDFEPSEVGRIVLPGSAGMTLGLQFTDTDGCTETIAATFNDDGVWVNDGNDEQYTSVTFPVGTETEGLAVLVPVVGDNFEYVISKLRTPTKFMFPRINSVFEQNEFVWRSSDPQVATVDENGFVTGRKSGQAVISASVDGMATFSANLTVKGEMALAKENGTEDLYIAEKAPIVTAINNAINTENKSALIAVVNGTSENKLSDINDFDYTLVNELSDDEIGELADRILTYEEFPCADIDDISELINVFMTEIKLGELNHISNADDVATVLNDNIGYYKIDLKNKYYIQYKNEVHNDFVDYIATNLKQMQKDYEEFYVMNAYNGASGYKIVQTVVEDCSKEIGYNKAHFNKNACADMYKKLISNRTSITDITLLRDFIDNYKKSADIGGGGGGGSSSGGGGGSSDKPSTNSPSVSGPGIWGNNSALIDNETLSSIQNVEVPAVTKLYNDVENGRWSYDAIQHLSAKGIISGYSDGNFCPQNHISRAEFIKLLVAASGLSLDEDENSDSIFADVKKDDWFYPYAKTAAKYGIALGDNNGNFNPEAQITREEIAVFVFRTCQSVNFKLDTKGEKLIADAERISDWAYTPVMQLVAAGVINGYNDGTFLPQSTATREETASLVYRFLLALDAEEVADA